MNARITFTVLVASLLLFAEMSVAKQTATADQANAPKIGNIKSSFNDGCGCSLRLKSEPKRSNRFVFVSDLGDKAQMNLDGVDVMLHLISRKDSTTKPQIGQRHSEVYESGTYKVMVFYKVTKVCPPKDENCEVVWYAASVTVARKSSGWTRQVPAVGECGC